MRAVFFRGFGLSCLAATALACGSFNTTRQASPRGTLGEEVYGVLCDRVSADALREDLTGESFSALCHKKNGAFGAGVDESKLPPITSALTDVNGKSVSPDQQRADRVLAIKKITALVAKRDELVFALDAMMPNEFVPVRSIGNKADTCSDANEGKLYDELAKMLGRFTELYNDGTIPESTRSIGRVVKAFRGSGDAQDAYGRLGGRVGYRPAKIALGVVRPVVGYPGLRDLSNALLQVLASDTNPFVAGDQRGPAYDKMSALLAAARAEMANAAADPPLAALTTSQNAELGLTALGRPRSSLEMVTEIMLAQNDAFGGTAPQYIVRRDGRGFARVAGPTLPAPFVDANGDGLPDVDDRGFFLSKAGATVPTPFLLPGAEKGPDRDEADRAIIGGKLAYQYVDTTRTFASRAMKDVRAMMDPAGKKETILDAMAGLPLMLGKRGATPTVRGYDDGSMVSYAAVDAKTSPMLDMAFAGLQVLGAQETDELLQVARQLTTKEQTTLARLMKAVLDGRAIAGKYPNAKLADKSVLWDELLDSFEQTAKSQNLMVDLMDALASDEAASLGKAFGVFLANRDEVSYNRDDLNGLPKNFTANAVTDPKTPVDRSKPDSGQNRSTFQRIVQLIADADGVAACNRDGAIVKARAFGFNVTLPIAGSYKECELYKIDDLGAFYLQSFVGKARFNIRVGSIRNGLIAGVGKATPKLMEDSSDITGFWPGATPNELLPKPEWLNRLVHFDPNDNKNLRTKDFIAGMNPEFYGTNLCAERTIDDPCAGGNCDFGGSVQAINDVAPDGKVRGLRNCQKDDHFQIRDKDTLFLFETQDFLRLFRPVVGAFVKNKSERVFAKLAVALNRHWQSDKGTASECKGPGGAPCAKSAASSYEELMSEFFKGDVFPATQTLMRTLKTMKVKRCMVADGKGSCSQTKDVAAFEVMAASAKRMLDQDLAKADKLTNFAGEDKALRNDGKTNPQVTPAYLLTTALSGFDEAYASAGDDGKARREAFVRARGQLADQFLATSGTGLQTKFVNPTMTEMSPVLIDLLRSQLWAHCPKSFAPPYERCTWAKDDLVKSMSNTITGPLLPALLDVGDALRADPDTRLELQNFARYLLDESGNENALPAMLASMVDVVQLLADDKNMVPFLKVFAEAFAASKVNGKGNVTEKGLVDAQLALLGKVSGKNFDSDGKQRCDRELDPNQIALLVAKNAVKPLPEDTELGKKLRGKTPIEVLIDIIADVNREDPELAANTDGSERLSKPDYEKIADSTLEFLTSRTRGLEQFYEIVRKGTTKEEN
jgi:hypothetical protein